MKASALFVVVTVLALSGCGISPTNYATSQEALRGSPALKNQFVADCVTKISRKPPDVKRAMATLMNTSVRRAPRVFCQRITKGISSGRLTHADMNAAARGQMTPATVRVLQGR